MKSKVYFIGVANHDTKDIIIARLNRLLDESSVLGVVNKNDEVAVKIHFGEEGNTGFVKPEYAKCICDRVVKKGARPTLTDTNTLYRGKRLNAKDHLALAYEHGFTEDVCGGSVVIADDSEYVSVDGKFITRAKIAPLFLKVDTIVGLSHFKGHIMTGFGGSLKNLGMGCASREGKLAQHSNISPVVRLKSCTGCGSCEEVCPTNAIAIVDKKSRIDLTKCIGCASCIAVCPFGAMDVPWERGAGDIQEKMVEYTKAVLKGKQGKAAFVNFAIKITKECDCLAKDDPRIAPDVGIFASADPVSIDKACLDAIKDASGKDVFKEVWPERDWSKQLNHAHKIGIGSLDYELIKL